MLTDAQDHLKHDIPIQSILVSFIITALVALLNIGSSAALNAIFSIANSALVTSYVITIGCMIYRRLQGKIPQSRYSLGKWGIWCNIISLIYLGPIYIFSFFPGTPNPTAQTMNWGVVMYGGIVIIATVYYMIWGRHQFTPPRESIDEMYGHDDQESYASEEAKTVGEKEIAHHEVAHTTGSDL
jgi:amino acid transporter